MQPIINLLADNPLLLLFVVIGLGYLIGSIRILGFSLGVAAVLFVGIAFGALDKRVTLPEPIYITGLALFVYAIGLQSGPGYFASFKKRGFRINVVASMIILAGALLCLGLWKLLGIPAPNMVGLFCGALTNTPALAASVEAVKSFAGKIPPDLYDAYLSAPVVSYGLAYPFGVLGVILWFFVFTKIFKIDFAKEEEQRRDEAGAQIIHSHTFNVLNPAVVGKKVQDALALLGQPGFALSRIRKGDTVHVVTPDILLDLNDQIVAVGTSDALERARLLFGEESAVPLSGDNDAIDYQRIFVSSPKVAGKKVHELQLEREFGATITRLRRGDVDFVPSPDTILELGDRIRVVTREDNFNRIRSLFGDSVKGISETDFLSISLGLVMGVIAGMIPLPLPNGATFKLGFAGGPLVVALILGKIERTGKIVWSIPFGASLVLRQLGLVFFLAGIGTRAGFGFGATFRAGGWELIAVGAFITSFVAITTIFVAFKYLKLPMSAVMGMVSGMHTQPACLAYANQQAQSDLPNVWYATVYPASMITKIILAQLLVSLMLTAM
ncbi:MAG: putative transporter [Ignavibacteriales bacterium]|nr:putative transporter [Ignavibacteriales bacterium]